MKLLLCQTIMILFLFIFRTLNNDVWRVGVVLHQMTDRTFMNESGYKDKNCKLLRKLTKLQHVFCYKTHMYKSKKCFSMFPFRNLFNDTFSTAQIYIQTVRWRMKNMNMVVIWITLLSQPLTRRTEENHKRKKEPTLRKFDLQAKNQTCGLQNMKLER